jgi:hypothetical protein
MSKFKNLERFSKISVGEANQIGLFYSEFEMIYQGYLYRPKNFDKIIRYYERRELLPSENVHNRIIEFGIRLLKI